MRGLSVRFGALVLGCLLWVQGAVAQHAFEVVSIKPSDPDQTGEHWNIDNNLTRINGITLKELVQNAFRMRTMSQVVGGPEWIEKDRFDVTATAGEAEYRQLVGPHADEEYAGLLLGMLRERFHLQAVEETQTLPRYVLEVDGPVKMTPTPLDANGKPIRRPGHGGDGLIDVHGLTMQDLADVLSGRPDVGSRTVINQTGLTAAYDFRLKWAADHGGGIAADAVDPDLVDAVRDQLGLRLRKDVGLVRVVVVQSATRPDFD